MEKKFIKLILIFIGVFLFVPKESMYGVDFEIKKTYDNKIDELISQMSLREKIVFLNGIRDNNVLVKGNERLGIKPFTIFHGPIGMKCNDKDGKRVYGTYFPVSIAMAATWNDDLIEQLGAALGAEIKAYGGMANAGPSMNIIRDPRGGRSFEYFTEDPYLNSRIAVANVKGHQSNNVAAIIKHFSCNNQELNRHTIDVEVSERALREIYLPGFEAAVKEGKAQAVMSAYNKVNGVYCSENPHLLNDILRDDWGFEGLVMSDWGGTHSTVEAAKNGLDIEMPRPIWFGDKLYKAVSDSLLSVENIDRMVKNVLRVYFWANDPSLQKKITKDIVRNNKHLELARKVSAESIVLLKNQNNILPLSKDIKSIAVIGPNGDYGNHFKGGAYNPCLFQGGGSANVNTLKDNMITPYIGLKNNASEGINVEYAPGCYAESGYGPIPIKYLNTENGQNGVKVEYFKDKNFKQKPIATELINRTSFVWTKGLDIPEANIVLTRDKYSSVRVSSILSVPETGEYEFEISNTLGKAKLFINDNLVVENLGSWRVWQNTGKVFLDRTKKYFIRVDYEIAGDRADLSINWNYENRKYLDEAKQLASRSDVVIFTIGLSGEMGEREAGDRLNMGLAPAQVKLINEVSKVNSNCVAVVIAGSAITMDEWIDSVHSILYAWYPGEQGGNAIADIIYGKVNPAGRLPITFPKSENVYPINFYSTTQKINYSEDIFVGYRYFDKYNKEVLFPFGYGLSYTKFEYSNLKTRIIENTEGSVKVKVSLSVKNTGKIPGDEVVQLYVSDLYSSVERPEKELKEFKRICLKPGESKNIEFELDSRAFSYWDENSSKWKLESGRFLIKVGSSSEDVRCEDSVFL